MFNAEIARTLAKEYEDKKEKAIEEKAVAYVLETVYPECEKIAKQGKTTATFFCDPTFPINTAIKRMKADGFKVVETVYSRGFIVEW